MALSSPTRPRLWRTRSAASRVDHQSALEYLHHHLPRCRCTHPVARDLINVRPAWMHLLRLPAFVDKTPPPPPSPNDALLAEFDLYLLRVAALTESMRRCRRRWA